MGKYTIGLDFGTLSARAVVADVRNGQIISSAVYAYPHGVMADALPDGTPLPPDWALQHPGDYLEALWHIVPEALAQSGVVREDVIGIGVDFTSCTVFPVDASGTPLCLLPAWAGTSHAYPKLWKHHAAQPYADAITRIALERKEDWLAYYGGKVSSEWSLPKLWQVLAEAPEVYDAMYAWAEAGDWLVWQLTGRITQNACAAGYKNFYRKGRGYPDPAFYRALDARLEHCIREKCFATAVPAGERAGALTEAMARRLGLLPGTAVSAAVVDAHAGVPAAGMRSPGQMLAILGTSACYMTLSETGSAVPGICGVQEEGMIPGLFGYEAGQSCMGDLFAWFCDHCVPGEYKAAADRCGQSIHQYLTGLAAAMRPGQSGLVALDWWNGNRSVLADFDLSGLLLGLTLQTRPEEIYRALLEAAAYGMRRIVENYREHGLTVHTVFATGGISQKNALAMQIVADVLHLPVQVVEADQGAALGSAVFAAAAAGADQGGYDAVFDAIAAMHAPLQRAYQPRQENAAVYDVLYAEYRLLHDYFGCGGNDVMKRLKALKHRVISEKN